MQRIIHVFPGVTTGEAITLLALLVAARTVSVPRWRHIDVVRGLDRRLRAFVDPGERRRFRSPAEHELAVAVERFVRLAVLEAWTCSDVRLDSAHRQTLHTAAAIVGRCEIPAAPSKGSLRGAQLYVRAASLARVLPLVQGRGDEATVTDDDVRLVIGWLFGRLSRSKRALLAHLRACGCDRAAELPEIGKRYGVPLETLRTSAATLAGAGLLETTTKRERGTTTTSAGLHRRMAELVREIDAAMILRPVKQRNDTGAA